MLGVCNAATQSPVVAAIDDLVQKKIHLGYINALSVVKKSAYRSVL